MNEHGDAYVVLVDGEPGGVAGQGTTEVPLSTDVSKLKEVKNLGEAAYDFFEVDGYDVTKPNGMKKRVVTAAVFKETTLADYNKHRTVSGYSPVLDLDDQTINNIKTGNQKWVKI